MYNADKQARAAGGRFGGKVEKVAEQVVAEVQEIVHEGATMVERGAHEIAQSEPFTYEEVRKSSVASVLALLVLAYIVGFLISCVF